MYTRVRAVGDAGKFIESHSSWFYYFYSRCLMREDDIERSYKLYSLFITATSGRENGEFLKTSLESIKKMSNVIYNTSDTEEKDEEEVTVEDLWEF